MSEPPQSILDLPPEIIEEIAHHVDPADLLVLRLVHKYVAAGTQRPMLKRNFGELNIILALPSSLRRALRVARHPHLRMYVSKVCIYIDRFHLHVLSTPSLLHPNGSNNALQRAFFKPERHWRMYSRWLKDQEWLERTGNDERELREIFYCLRGSTDMEIGFFDLLIDDETFPRDFAQLTTEYGDIINMWPDWNYHRPLQIVLNAIKESSLQPASFVHLCGRYGIPLSMFTPGNGFGEPKLVESFRKITHLTLILQAGPGEPDSLSEPKVVSHFINFLQEAAHRLMELHLNAAHYVHDEDDHNYTVSDLDAVFKKMVSEKVFFPCIKMFSLCNIKADYASLIAYLSAHRRTMLAYGLRSVFVSSTGSELQGEEFEEKVWKDLTGVGLPIRELDSIVVNDDVEE